MALFAMLTALVAGGDPITCTMTARDPEHKLVLPVTLDPVPSLKDQPGVYRVMMDIRGTKLRGNAQPMTDTAEDDVMFRAKAPNDATYTLGLRHDGAAAMYVSLNGTSMTLTGWCQRHEQWFRGWLHATDEGEHE